MGCSAAARGTCHRVGRSLITGISGQDGWYLAQYLHGLGEDIVGVSRTGAAIDDLPFVQMAPMDLADTESVRRAIATSEATTVYHLAAQSSVGISWDDPVGTGDITGLGTARVLDAVRLVAPQTRVFIASSSEVFGDPEQSPQDEATAIRPVSPYGASKAYALHLARIYRRRHGLFVGVGLLFNHESPRRPPGFVTRKITSGAVAIAAGRATELRLGNLDAIRDWGAAVDFVQAMHAIVTHDEPDDFVIATGKPHSVRDWCQSAFALVGLDYRQYVVCDPAFWRPAEETPLVGNPAKANAVLNWRSTTDLQSLVASMIAQDQNELGSLRMTTAGGR